MAGPPTALRGDPDKIRNRWLANVPDPATAPVARRIVLAVASGQPYNDIARQLARENVPTARQGKAWLGTTVAKIAGNARAYAELGIVTPDQADGALATLAATAGMGRGKGTKAQSHRYSSCVACHRCGAMLRGCARPGQATRYVCPGGHLSVRADAMDAYVDAWCIARLSQPDALAVTADSGEDAAVARREAAALQAELDEWVTAGISARAYALKEAEIMPRIRAAQARAQQAATVPALAGLADTDADVVAARWHSLTLQARKAAVRVLAPQATMGPGKPGNGTVPVHDRLTMA